MRPYGENLQFHSNGSLTCTVKETSFISGNFSAGIGVGEVSQASLTAYKKSGPDQYRESLINSDGNISLKAQSAGWTSE